MVESAFSVLLKAGMENDWADQGAAHPGLDDDAFSSELSMLNAHEHEIYNGDARSGTAGRKKHEAAIFQTILISR
ncbi:unnamed protein product [Gongylonema pulchrum]|uniref:Transposase n=1 Tax=Gongylonema pulchrum TaxID=637853 RepID=A0A183DI89_9BILA|nr:unnamed protein product [Gongylonema pulchrum]